MSFQGKYQESITAKIDSAHGLVTPVANMTRSISSVYDSATTYFTASTTITGAGDEYDLAGALTDDLGDTVQFKEVHLVHFKNNSTAAAGNNMILGSASTHIPIFKTNTDSISMEPQASFTILDDTGIAVTGGSADTINIWGTAGDAYELVVVGRRTA